MSFLKNINGSPSDYAEAAVVAKDVGEELLAQLDWMILKPKLVLDMGCGPGNHSVELKKRYPDATILALDNDLPMLEYAQEKAKVKTLVCAEGNKLPLRDQSVDLVFANFFLPWQQDIKPLLSEWLRVLTPNGLLMVTALGLDTLQEWHSVLSEETTPTRVDMHDVGDALVQAGFSDPVLEVSHYQVTYRDKTRLIQELQKSGLWVSPILCDKVKTIPAVDGVWSLTYEIIFAHAFAPLATNEFAVNEGEVRIPLAHLRRQLRT